MASIPHQKTSPYCAVNQSRQFKTLIDRHPYLGKQSLTLRPMTDRRVHLLKQVTHENCNEVNLLVGMNRAAYCELPATVVTGMISTFVYSKNVCD
jgi:hypothetical protein